MTETATAAKAEADPARLALRARLEAVPAAPRQLPADGGRRAWTVWGVAVLAYVVAVLNRSSLGVAGLLAADRFHIQATELALFTAVQLLVYAGLQVPVGLLL